MPRWPRVVWVFLGLGAGALVGAFLAFLYTHPAQAAVLRDVLIIVLTLQLALLSLILLFVAYRLLRLINWLQEEVRPILGRARETVETVHGTSVFLSRRLVRPTIEVASAATGATQALQALIRLLRGHAR